MNGMKLTGVVLVLLAVGAAAIAVRQYQAESRDETYQAMRTSPGIQSDQSQEDVPAAGWGVPALGAVVLGVVGAICIAKSSGKAEG